MKTNSTPADRAASRAAKAEIKVAQAEAKLAKAEARVEARKAKLEAARRIYRATLAEAERLGASRDTPAAEV